MMLLPLKCTCMPKLLQVFLNLSLKSSCLRYYNGNTFVATPSVIGVAFTIVDCLCAVNVMPVIKFHE